MIYWWSLIINNIKQEVENCVLSIKHNVFCGLESVSYFKYSS